MKSSVKIGDSHCFRIEIELRMIKTWNPRAKRCSKKICVRQTGLGGGKPFRRSRYRADRAHDFVARFRTRVPSRSGSAIEPDARVGGKHIATYA